MLDKYNIEQLEMIRDIVVSLIEISNASIIKNNFIKAFYTNTVDGRLRGTYNLFGAISFRLTSQSPNLLNLPSNSTYAKPIKEALIAPKGYVIYQVDLSALEDRVIANLSGDKNKIATFTSGVDGHTLHSIYYKRQEWNKIFPPEEDESDFDYAKRIYKEIENGNKQFKKMRQESKSPTFALAYGAYPDKVSAVANISVEEAKNIFDIYHNELYEGISKYRNKVYEYVQEHGYIHLGLGCILKSSKPDTDIRSLFNATCQFWSILTLLTIHDLNVYVKENNLEDDIKVISSIYDSIYIQVKKDPTTIRIVNDFVIPKLTKDFIENQIVHNEAQGEIGYDWYNTIQIPITANEFDIAEILNKLDY